MQNRDYEPTRYSIAKARFGSKAGQRHPTGPTQAGRACPGAGFAGKRSRKNPENGSNYPLPQVPDGLYRSDMPYQVKSGSITFVVATVRQALAMFDQMLEDAREELSICDMDGRKIDPDLLRSQADDEQGRPG
jgi:hypothetical protein